MGSEVNSRSSSDSGSSKREVPSTVRKILDMDIELTKRFVMLANKRISLESLAVHFKMLEISCHGIPWFAFWIAFTWVFNNQNLVEMQVNMLFGLVIDIILVAVLKAFTRRRRPKLNKDDALGQIGPDKFSFPSGHASRAVFVTYFFLYLYTVPIVFWPTLLAWSGAICMSRILMSRHYILDVVGGITLGFIEGVLLSWFWISEETSMWIIYSISDDNIEGASYHV